MKSKFTIKFATPKDIPLILTFIKELARYEKLAHEVKATKKDIAKTLFGKRRYAEVIIAYCNKEPVGFALFFHNYSTFLGKPGIYLEDLYVKPKMRGHGLGKMLLAYLAKLAIERNCGRLEWWVLDWNKPAIKFYKMLNAQAMDQWTVYRITGKKLSELATNIDDFDNIHVRRPLKK